MSGVRTYDQVESLKESALSSRCLNASNPFLDFLVCEDLDRIFGEDVAESGPDCGYGDEVSIT